MRMIDAWLEDYGDSHRNPVNKTIHRIAVPIIVLDVLGLLHIVPTAGLLPGAPNAAVVVTLAALVFYARLSMVLTLGMALLSAAGLALVAGAHAALGAWFLPSLVAVFVAAWIAQFVGHSIEGRKPSFFEDVQFLLIGPLWLLVDVYRRLGIRYSDDGGRDAARGSTPASIAA